MEFTSTEKDLVQNYWIDFSQDPDFISQDTGIDKNTVLDILTRLNKEGRIDGFNIDEISKVRKFNEIFNYR
jgi:hypothetical protein